jgi:hypothetical protein
MKIIKFQILIVLLIVFVVSCQQIKNITHSLTNFAQLKFKIENVTNFILADVPLSTKSSLSDFSIAEGLKLTNAFATQKLPATFTINIAVKNPNTGQGGTKQIPVTITRLRWKLFVDGVETIAGTMNKEFFFPASNEIGHFPLDVNLDIYQFFANRGYNGLINLALTLGGYKSNPSKIVLEAEPTFSTPLGTIQGPMVRINSESFN